MHLQQLKVKLHIDAQVTIIVWYKIITWAVCLHHNYVISCYILLIISRYFWLLLLLMELLYTAVLHFLWVKYFLHHCRQRRYAPAFSGCILLLGCQQQLVIIQSQLIVFFCLCYRGCETGLQPDHHSSAYPLQLGLRVHKAALWHTEGQAAQLWGVHPVSPGRFHADHLLSLFSPLQFCLWPFVWVCLTPSYFQSPWSIYMPAHTVLSSQVVYRVLLQSCHVTVLSETYLRLSRLSVCAYCTETHGFPSPLKHSPPYWPD